MISLHILQVFVLCLLLSVGAIAQNSQTTDLATATSTSTSSSTATVAAEADLQVALNFDNTQIYPPPQPPVSVTCTECHLDGDISFSGSVDGDNTGNINFTALNPNFTFTDPWLGLSVANFKGAFNLNLTVNNGTNSLSFDLITSKELPVPGVGALAQFSGTQFGIQAVLSITIQKPISFAYGFDMSVPDHSAVLVSGSTKGMEFSSVGFNETKVTSNGFNSSDPELDFILSLSLQPYIALTNSSVFTGIVFIDAPTISINVTHLASGNNACDTPRPGDTVYENLTRIEEVVAFDEGFNLGFGLKSVRTTDTDTFGLFSETLVPTCLQYDASIQGLASPTTTPTPSSTGSPDAKKNGSHRNYKFNVDLMGMLLVGLILVLI